MDYLLKEVNNYTLIVGDRNFIVHEPLLDILPNIRLLNKQYHFDLNDLLLDEYVEALDLRFKNEIVVYDEVGNAHYNEEYLLELLSDTFDTLYKWLYHVETKLPFKITDEEFNIKLESVFWLMDFLGVSNRLLPIVHSIFNKSGLFSKAVKARELYIVAEILGWNPLKGGWSIKILTEKLNKGDVFGVIEELKNIGYFSIAAYVELIHSKIEIKNDYSFSSLFCNVNIENYHIISKDGGRSVIHSPVGMCNKELEEDKEIFIRHPTDKIELALDVLYRSLFNDTDLLLILLNQLNKEDIGLIYFIFKQLIVLSLFNIGRDIAKYFHRDYKSHKYDQGGLVTTLIEDAIREGDVKYLESSFPSPKYLRGPIAAHIPCIVSLLISNASIIEQLYLIVLPA